MHCNTTAVCVLLAKEKDDVRDGIIKRKIMVAIQWKDLDTPCVISGLVRSSVLSIPGMFIANTDSDNSKTTSIAGIILPFILAIVEGIVR